MELRHYHLAHLYHGRTYTHLLLLLHPISFFYALMFFFQSNDFVSALNFKRTIFIIVQFLLDFLTIRTLLLSLSELLRQHFPPTLNDVMRRICLSFLSNSAEQKLTEEKKQI